MSFIAIHGDRLLARLIDPSAFYSHFLGGPSSVGFVFYESIVLYSWLIVVENSDTFIRWSKYSTCILAAFSTTIIIKSRCTQRFWKMENRTYYSISHVCHHSKFLCFQLCSYELSPSGFIGHSCTLGSVFFLEFIVKTMLKIDLLGMDVVLNDYCPKKALPVANIIRYFLSTSAFAGLW